jgi:hypothetical protein
MSDLGNPYIVDELAARTRQRMDLDPAYRRRVFRSVGDDPAVLAALHRRLADGSVSLAAKRQALETLEELELDVLAPDMLNALRVVLLATGYGELHATAARILAQYGSSATESPEAVFALTAIAENPVEQEDARKWAVACLATVAPGNREVRLALSRIAREDGQETVRYEAEHALVFGSSLLSNWVRALSRQPLFRSALLQDIADYGVEGFLPLLAPGARTPIVGLGGSIGSAAAGASIDPVLRASSHSPEIPRPAAVPSAPPPGSTGPLHFMDAPQPADRGETSGLTWELSLPGNGRCRMEISSLSNSQAVVYQVFETGTEYPQQYGFMGYVLLRTVSATPDRSFGALQWVASSLPASPNWLFQAVDRGLLSEHELTTLRHMPQVVADVDPDAAPVWQRWLAEPETTDEGLLEQ